MTAAGRLLICLASLLSTCIFTTAIAAQNCSDACTQPRNFSRFIHDPSAGGATVTIYVNQAARDSPWFTRETVESGIDRWNSKCAGVGHLLGLNSTGTMTFPGDWQSRWPYDAILIKFLSGEVVPSGEDGSYHPANIDAEGELPNTISVYEICPVQGNSGLDCFGNRLVLELALWSKRDRSRARTFTGTCSSRPGLWRFDCHAGGYILVARGLEIYARPMRASLAAQRLTQYVQRVGFSYV